MPLSSSSVLPAASIALAISSSTWRSTSSCRLSSSLSEAKAAASMSCEALLPFVSTSTALLGRDELVAAAS